MSLLSFDVLGSGPEEETSDSGCHGEIQAEAKEEQAEVDNMDLG